MVCRLSRQSLWSETRTNRSPEKLEYVDETADWAKHYARGAQSETGSDDDTQEERQELHLRTSSFRSGNGSDHGGPSRLQHSGRMGPPSPIQAIPRSSDVFESSTKRRKTNESMPSLARSNSNNYDSPSSNFSLPLQSPNFSFPSLNSQPYDRPLSAHGSVHESTHESAQSLDFASRLGSTRISDHDLLDDSAVDIVQSGIGGNGYSDAISPPKESPYDLLSPRFWNQQSVWPHPSLQEACLMRYFVENLAHWVSLAFSNLADC